MRIFIRRSQTCGFLVLENPSIMNATKNPLQIVILGGGFGGAYTARHLEKQWRGRSDVKITLISRDNYFLMTPLLFEAASGVLEPRHTVNPLRPFLRSAQFVEGEIRGVDFEKRLVSVKAANDTGITEFEYNQLVLALGGVTNLSLIPGAENAITFKTLGDAIYLRNQVIRLFESADVEKDPVRRKAQLTFVVIGAGLVGLELMGELTEFVSNVAEVYHNVRPEEISFEMIEAGPKIAPEFDEKLADYSGDLLKSRGVKIRTSMRVKAIHGSELELQDGQRIAAETIVVATGVSPNPLLAKLQVTKNPKGRADVDSTMRVKEMENVWALGDCASIPDASGKPYPPLAQHALREAKVLADNITAVIRGQQPRPFVYASKGTLAALGHFKGAGQVYGINIHGFLAWWVWRTYYLMRMPPWSRRLRIVIDWTVALFFRNDVVQLDQVRGNALASKSD